MLDQETKRKIDTARDILVGKLPNPQSQIEQITIAMIYKFMDDMDKEAIEFGGVPTFFIGDYEKYSWTKIFDPKLGGYEMLALYGEAIVKLNQNPHIPQLFRDIFKNAYLPYRDPETLKMFLKVINEFTYDHSEKLGDAFEYLLSVLGSQGDAGQFRTPRHIIDFMVEIIQPKKEESICDPACGTAGFLISSYKHIITQNTKNNKGDLLTPDERKKITNNFVGYDISSEMVRLSLVNMYLHGFTSPKIYEYDTLTSTDRWGDTFDIILANPPFMTPKGGIRPHKKFAMKANRSEVLFVDYIMEHINPTTGRAAVIVPEGIIFQSAKAYKALRKMLVENKNLYGVISLPAGVFQPYSGVKTSILLMDKSIAKKTDKILFVKIENDGFSLGAQRKELPTSDLPDAINIITGYQLNVRNNEDFDENSLPENCLLVDKSKIAENGEYNLSGERYTASIINKHENYEWVMLHEVCQMQTGSRDKGGALAEGIPSLGGEQINSDGTIRLDKMKFISRKHFDGLKKGVLQKDDVLLVKDGATTGKVGFYYGNFKDAAINEHVYLLRTNEKIIPLLLYHLLRSNTFQIQLKKYIKGIIGGISSEISKIEIPLPPLSVQQEIVSKIEQYEKIIAGARQVVENYKPQIDINPEWEMVELSTIAVVNEKSVDPIETFGNTDFCYIDISSVENETGKISFDNIIPTKNAPSRARRVIKTGDILLSTVRPNLKAFAFIQSLPEKCLASTGFAIITVNSNTDAKYLYYCLFNNFVLNQMYDRMGKGSYPSINQTDVNVLKIPVPSLSEQQFIVSQIEKEQQLVNANKELIEIYEQKIKDEINKLWEE